MNALALLLDQRCQGQVHLRMERSGIAVLSESGSAKVRVPRGTHDAILINTSGGLAGGDEVSIHLDVGEGAKLSATTQAAERLYRSLGPAANINVSLKASGGSTLMWLPQEMIVYQGSTLNRRIDVDLATDCSFIALESMVFGRHAMGEVVSRLSIKDRWHIHQNGKLIHAEAFQIGPEWMNSQATFADNRATATFLMISTGAEQLLDRVSNVLGYSDSASAWNGKLVVRLLANDGYELRKKLIPLMREVIGVGQLPKCWTF